MSNPKIFINEKYTKKDGSSAIYIIVHLDRKSIKFATGVSCKPSNFNFDTNRLKGNSKAVKDDNLIIDQGLARINEIFVRYRLQNEQITPDTLRKEWMNPTRRVNFYAWLDETIKGRKGTIADSTQKQHFVLLSKMQMFKKTLTFADIDAEFIEQFRVFLKMKLKNDINTMHNTLKTLRSYLNIAVRQSVITENPFLNIKIKKTATERVYLTDKELKALWQVYEKHTLPQSMHYVCRHFLFMCFTGIRISDLLSIEHDNIYNNTLIFYPQKTRGIKKTGLKIPLNKYALQLVADEGRKIGKVFMCNAEQQMNKKLKDIAAVAQIHKKISNHTGRHTFATLYYKKTKDLAGLQVLLGHSDIQQTMIYVHVDEAQIRNTMQIFEQALALT